MIDYILMGSIESYKALKIDPFLDEASAALNALSGSFFFSAIAVLSNFEVPGVSFPVLGTALFGLFYLILIRRISKKVGAYSDSFELLTRTRQRFCMLSPWCLFILVCCFYYPVVVS